MEDIIEVFNINLGHQPKTYNIPLIQKKPKNLIIYILFLKLFYSNTFSEY